MSQYFAFGLFRDCLNCLLLRIVYSAALLLTTVLTVFAETQALKLRASLRLGLVHPWRTRGLNKSISPEVCARAEESWAFHHQVKASGTKTLSSPIGNKACLPKSILSPAASSQFYSSLARNISTNAAVFRILAIPKQIYLSVEPKCSCPRTTFIWLQLEGPLKHFSVFISILGSAGGSRNNFRPSGTFTMQEFFSDTGTSDLRTTLKRGFFFPLALRRRNFTTMNLDYKCPISDSALCCGDPNWRLNDDMHLPWRAAPEPRLSNGFPKWIQGCSLYVRPDLHERQVSASCRDRC